MPKVASYLECGCALLEGGGITRCPKHDWELEKQFGESQTKYPTQEEFGGSRGWWVLWARHPVGCGGCYKALACVCLN